MSKTPKVRFTWFSDDWEQRKLGELASSFEYGLNAAAKEFDGKNKYLRITDIDDASRIFKIDDLTSPDTDIEKAEAYRLHEGDILFARTGASVGKSFIYKESDGLVYYAGFLIRARILPEYSAEFVFQNTLTPAYEKYIQITSQRSGQPGVNAQEYADYSLMIPDYAEQVKIGSYLRQLDHLITLHQRKCEKLIALKAACLDKMFPKAGCDAPVMRVSGFSKPWSAMQIKGIITEKLSNGIINHPGDDDSSVRHINVTNMYTPDKVRIEDLTYSAYDDIAVERCNVEYGDIFMTRSSVKPEGIAEPNVLLDTGKYVFDDHLIRMKINQKENDPLFVKISLETPFLRRQFISRSKTAAFTTIGQDDIVDCFIYLPELSEQIKIAALFSNIDSLITLHQRKLEKLRQFKQAMMHNMFV